MYQNFGNYYKMKQGKNDQTESAMNPACPLLARKEVTKTAAAWLHSSSSRLFAQSTFVD